MNKVLITCRVCNSQSQQEYLSTIDFNQEKSDDQFKYYRCCNCRSIFIYPIPNNLSLFYRQDYPAYSVKNSSKIESNLKYLETAKLEIVKQHVSSGKLIEIGPAAGRFLTVANGAGFDVFGIEQDTSCAAHISNTLKLQVACSDKPTDELKKLASCCDVVVAWHVIEHLQDLRGFSTSASKALRGPNSVVIVSAPNPESWSFKIFGRYWVHLDAPRHLTLIPLQALDKLMADQGLKRISCVFNDPVGLQLNKMGWQKSLMNLSSSIKVREKLLIRLGRLLSIAMAMCEKIPGRGAAYTVTYKKIEDFNNSIEAR